MLSVSPGVPGWRPGCLGWHSLLLSSRAWAVGCTVRLLTAPALPGMARMPAAALAGCGLVEMDGEAGMRTTGPAAQPELTVLLLASPLSVAAQFSVPVA